VRIFIEAAHYLSRTGCQVRLLPKEYGNCFCIYQRFLYWEKLGIWEGMFNYFQDTDQEYFMIDGTIIRAKIHALVDALGNPIKFLQQDKMVSKNIFQIL
jgi:transposase